jgi:tellurite resistance protein
MADLDDETQALYVRALIAIAMADREIDANEGARLDEIVRKRCPGVSVAELMFEPNLRTDEVSRALRTEGEGGPFRSTKIDPHELGRMFVEDALLIIAAHEGISSSEEAALLRFAPLFGLPLHEVRHAMGALK